MPLITQRHPVGILAYTLGVAKSNGALQTRHRPRQKRQCD